MKPIVPPHEKDSNNNATAVTHIRTRTGKLSHKATSVPCWHPCTAQHTFDIIIADPPYNIGKDFGNESDKRALS